MTFTNEIQILAHKNDVKCTWKWYDKLEDATTPMFSKRKAIAEDELNYFFYSHDELVDSGYIRSVIYYFKKGDSDEECGGNHVKAFVEHYFTSDTNMTYDYFKDFFDKSWPKSGPLSDNFKVNPSPTLKSKYLVFIQDFKILLHLDYIVISFYDLMKTIVNTILLG